MSTVSSSNVSELRHRTLWVALGWGFVALVVYLSLMRPPDAIVAEAFDFGHLIAYGWMMTWFVQIHRTLRARLVVGALLCMLGIGLEFLQGTTDYRKFDFADMGMNTLGVGIGLLLAFTPVQNALRAIERRFVAR